MTSKDEAVNHVKEFHFVFKAAIMEGSYTMKQVFITLIKQGCSGSVRPVILPFPLK
jgi:hypothetical protein